MLLYSCVFAWISVFTNKRSVTIHVCIEIVGGAILLVASLVIVFLTLMQHTHGQGLSGAINGSVGGANNARLTPADQMLAKVTRIAGVVFFVVAILACLFAGRLAG